MEVLHMLKVGLVGLAESAAHISLRGIRGRMPSL